MMGFMLIYTYKGSLYTKKFNTLAAAQSHKATIEVENEISFKHKGKKYYTVIGVYQKVD